MIRRSIGFNLTNSPTSLDGESAETTYLFSEALRMPDALISYWVGQHLMELYPGKALVETTESDFELERYARAGYCRLEERVPPHSQRVAEWLGPCKGIREHSLQVWYQIEWQGSCLDVLAMYWNCDDHFFVLAESKEVASRFVNAVCAWNTELRGEVLVFQFGHWRKDDELFRAIKGSTLDNLVLPGMLKEEMRDDLLSFFAAREMYDEYGVPWKRGVLLVGPPGNGKTHAVKALINALGQRCLYVKSFRSRGDPDEASIRTVFQQARKSAPCILVLEDLDSLITTKNRSFFLNELDGFANNAGILTLATTNHPECLDPAIVERPSRFDRKYPFDLPALEERRRYIAQWNASLRPALRLSEPGMLQVAEQTDGFSFAYLKELFLSSIMRWIATAEPGAMDCVMVEQTAVLREQMASAPPEPIQSQDDDAEEFEDEEADDWEE